MRIAYARINQETNALSPVATTLEDFAATHLLEGEILGRACQRGAAEVPGMFKEAELSGFVAGATAQAAEAGAPLELIPTVSAWAVPSGPLSRACFEALMQKLIASLRAAGKLDAVYLCLHGAMNVQDLPLPASEGPESEVVRRVREVVGAVPIAVSLDLHGNITQGLVDKCDLLQAYRTNPHRDHRAVGAGLGRQLVRLLRGEIQPRIFWRSLPVILGGGPTLDFWPPMRGIFRRARAMERGAAVLGASIMMVHPWNAHPEIGWSVLVMVDLRAAGAPAIGERYADELADRCWEVRHQQAPAFVGPKEAIAAARRAWIRRKLGAVVISDASDVVSAGAPGENTALLAALISEGSDLVSYVPLRDPALVEELWGGPVGRTVRVKLGGKLDPRRGVPLEVEAAVIDLRRAHGVERMAVLAIGKTKVVVTEGPALCMRPQFYKDAGLDPLRADVVVVKNFFPFLLYFLPYSRKYIFVRTSGVTDLDSAFALPFAGPVHPRDRVSEWRSTDRRRREAPRAA
jgi:microcystin degradation protein MlrC